LGVIALELLRRFLPVDFVALRTVRGKHFLYLLVQQFLSLVATYSVSFASLAKVVDVTGSGIQSAFTILSVTVPGLVFGPLGGVTVDRVSRRTMLIATNVLRGIVALTATFYLRSAPLDIVVPCILATNFVLSAVGQFNFPAEAALIPTIVTSEELLVANSAFNVSYLAAIGIGSGVWGPLSVRFLGVEWTYFVSGSLFIITLIPLWLMPADRAPRERVLRRSRFARLRHLMTVISDIEEAVHFAVGNRKVGTAILALISQTALALGLGAVVPVLFAKRFGIALYNLPLILLPAGAGAGAGFGILLSRLGSQQPRIRLVMLGNSLIAVGLVGYTLALGLQENGVWLFSALSPLVGLGFVLSYISGKSVLQEEPPAFLCGRVISLQLTLNNVASLVPTVLAGWVFDAFGAEVVFVVAVVLFLVVIIGSAIWVGQPARAASGEEDA